VQTALELPQSLYDQAERAARSQGVSVAEFVAEALEEKLRAARRATGKGRRVELPVVPSGHPGTRPLSAERVAELLREDDVPR
jgi:hypothetical protein